jgi:hypothetical protein
MTVKTIAAWAILAAGLTLVSPRVALAHCDSLDGPVVKAAQEALDRRSVAYALIWVHPDGEAEVRAAFDHVLAVRALDNPKARALADRYFFETVVRIHRAGEGAPFTGLQPAGRDLGPAIPAADHAIAEGSLKSLAALLTARLSEGLHHQFEAVAGSRIYDPNDVAAGRRFVAAYVEYVHYVERLYEAISTSSHGHFTEAPPRAQP